MLPEILQRTLTARQRGFGLELWEPDDHRVSLGRKDAPIKTWVHNERHPTMIEIQEEADRIIESEEGLFSFEAAR